MSAVMAKRIRLSVDADEVLRKAIKLRLLKEPDGTTASDLVVRILRDSLSPEIAQIESYSTPTDRIDTPKRPRGRPRKEGGE